MIYSEHFFELLEYPHETSMFLAESLRVLAPGGLFRIAIPDTEPPIVSYRDGDDAEWFKRARDGVPPPWTRMHNINFHFRHETQHKYAYDYETLARVLTKAGFSNILRTDFDPGMDTGRRRFCTLYVEAQKPPDDLRGLAEKSR